MSTNDKDKENKKEMSDETYAKLIISLTTLTSIALFVSLDGFDNPLNFMICSLPFLYGIILVFGDK